MAAKGKFLKLSQRKSLAQLLMDDTDLLVVPAAAAGRRARGSGRAMSEEVSRCHSWGLTNTIRMKSVTFGKLITPEFRAMNGIHQLQPLLP